MLPIARPGLATIAVWTIVQVWGNFLVPFILLRDPDKQPAAVLMYTFYTEGGQAEPAADLRRSRCCTRSRWSCMYLFVNRRYGFRFHGGIKS